MAQQDIYLSVVVPAYNEAERLPNTLRRFHEYLSEAPFSYEIIVVLDGSTDSTLEIVNGMTSEMKNLSIVERGVNRGKGYTVREGMLRASGHIRLFSDADNSTDISHFDKMRPLFDRGCDVVICSRHPKDARGARQAVPQASYKRLLGHAGNLVVQLVAVRGIWDTQCGFKAFRDHAAEKIFSQTLIDGWGFDIEVLALAQKLKHEIGIVPAFWINDPRSHMTFSGYLQVLFETIRIRWNLFRGKYHL